MSSRKFVNLTACKSFQDIERAISLFLSISKCKVVYDIKIDSICLLLKLTFNPLEIFRSNANFFIKSHPKFKGISVRDRSSKTVCNLFPSNKIVFMGLRDVSQISSFLSAMKI